MSSNICQNLNKTDRQRFFAMQLREMQAWLHAHHIEYRILGSVATSAYLDNGITSSLDFTRNASNFHQKMPDVDVIIPMKDIPVAQAYRKKLEKDPVFPINLEILPAQCHFDWRPFEQISYITHRDLYVPVPSSVFNPVEQYFAGVPIITVDARTLFHTYVVLGGMLRHKDWHGALGLARLIQDGKTCHSEEEYRPFHEFLRLRTMQYPEYRRYRQISHWVRTHVPSRLHYWGVHYGKFIQPLVFGTKSQKR